MKGNKIRFTPLLPVWVFIGSAYFIVITQMSEKGDIFSHQPGGDESEKEVRRAAQEAGEQGKTYGRKENGCQVFFFF